MDNTIDTVTISNDPLADPALDFQYLRQEGVKHIQRLAGKIWTDYNLHDPGITILDQLCYAITDLSYRINYDIKDLLAEENENSFKSLYTPAQILTVNPVTLSDVRKVVVDVEGVKNAWVEKVSQPDPEIFYDSRSKSLNLADPEGNAERINILGLFRILIEKSESTTQGTNILPNVTRKLQSCRNLCEDFAEIKILDLQPIILSGNIEVGQVEDINTFAANVLYRIANFISPPIKFYTLEELLNKGKRIDEIFEGPALQHGFIDDDELAQNDKRTELHTSDIIRELMDEPEVVTVNQIAVSIGSEAAQNWRLVLDKERVARLNWQMSLKSLNFIKNDLKLTVNSEEVERVFTQLRDSNLYFPLEENKRDIKLKAGKYRDIEKYYSIQNQFPQTYGIGEIGLPESASLKRLVQAKQLKAYLLFFEQILANYFAQVAHTKDLFSFYNTETNTYFHTSLVQSVPGAAEVLNDINKYESGLATITENDTTAVERKNRFLNHLLSRFSESLTDYSLWLYDQSIKTSQKKASTDRITETPTTKIVEDKLSFLRNYPLISNDRGKAFNYTLKSWGTENISGLEKRIAGKLGMSNYTKSSLLESNARGFHMLEHILLRPLPEDSDEFLQYLSTKVIDSFEGATATNTKCNSLGHGLQNGEQIEIRGSEGYDGEYNVEQVLTDSFQIEKAYIDTGKKDGSTGTSKATWQRKQVNTKILLLTRPATAFSAAADNNKTVVEAVNHGLAENESVEIIGTNNYNGIYKALNVSANTFVIDKVFTEKETAGRWINPSQRKDPYSLQLTFVFPDFVKEELSDDDSQKANYRAYIENTIREETPVHLSVYIRWLDKDELLKFEKAYQTFLDQLSNN